MFRFTDLVILRLTRDCNLNCKYCFMTNKSDYKGEIISDEVFKGIIDKIIEQRIIQRKQHDPVTIVFHGGEALLVGHKRLYQFAEYITDRMNRNECKFNLGMQTNAVLLDDEFAKILNKFEIHVGMSFDGVNDANAGRTDIKQTVFEKKFHTLKNNSVGYGFLVVGSKQSVDHIDETMDYLDKLEDVNSFKINYAEDMFTPGPDSPIEVEGSEFFEKVYKHVIDRFIETGEAQELQTMKFVGQTLIDLLVHFEKRSKSGCGELFCGSVMGMIGVNPDGTSHYCDRYDKEYEDTYVMNVLDYDFLGIHQIRRALHFNLSRDKVIRETGCDTCFARNVCDGGCMAFHRSKYGHDGIDTRLVCGLYKNLYSYVLENIVDITKAYAKAGEVITSPERFLRAKEQMRTKLYNKGVEVKLEYNDDIDRFQIIFEETKID